jgi:hypothetical protein
MAAKSKLSRLFTAKPSVWLPNNGETCYRSLKFGRHLENVDRQHGSPFGHFSTRVGQT